LFPKWNYTIRPNLNWPTCFWTKTKRLSLHWCAAHACLSRQCQGVPVAMNALPHIVPMLFRESDTA
jgi:hypothetical protein